jgi:hypothetical protein
MVMRKKERIVERRTSMSSRNSGVLNAKGACSNVSSLMKQILVNSQMCSSDWFATRFSIEMFKSI